MLPVSSRDLTAGPLIAASVLVLERLVIRRMERRRP